MQKVKLGRFCWEWLLWKVMTWDEDMSFKSRHVFFWVILTLWERADFYRARVTSKWTGWPRKIQFYLWEKTCLESIPTTYNKQNPTFLKAAVASVVEYFTTGGKVGVQFPLGSLYFVRQTGQAIYHIKSAFRAGPPYISWKVTWPPWITWAIQISLTLPTGSWLSENHLTWEEWTWLSKKVLTWPKKDMTLTKVTLTGNSPLVSQLSSYLTNYPYQVLTIVLGVSAVLLSSQLPSLPGVNTCPKVS